ncbi:MAG: 3-phosphoglycerate dehydrogenase family protein [Rhodothermales bacterium]
MTILLADALPASCIERLEKSGHTVLNAPALKGDDLVTALATQLPTVLVVRSTKVPAAAIEADPNLELVVRAGAGYDTIDVNAASERGVFVANCPGKNADAVAELTIGLMLSLDRRLPDNVSDARAGAWNKGKYGKAQGLKGRTLGLIGMGNIGQRVADIATAMGMEVIAWSRSLTDATAEACGVRRCMSPLDVAAAADVVSLHVASTPETRHLANRVFFETMKPGAFFINTTRSAVVDEEALVWALDARPISAALDVFEGEPAGKDGAFSHPLASHPNVYISHHIGASTEQAQDAIAEEAVRIIESYHVDGVVPNCVNLADRSPATHLLTVRHLDKVGVLANVLDEVRKAGWNVQEMENLIFSGAKAACARIRFDGSPSEATLDNIRKLPDILAVSAIAL